MLYTEKTCSNSSYWQSYRLLSIVLLGVGIIAFLIFALMFIRYLYNNDKDKRVKKKIIKYVVIIISSLLVFASGAILAKHVDNKTKKMAHCWDIG